MKKISFSHFCLALLLATGCQKQSGNMWEDNQTGAKYNSKNAAALWGENSSSEENFSQQEFVALDDSDLKNQFADIAIPQGNASLGEGGVPSADEFTTPHGELAAIFHPVFFNTDQHTLQDKNYLEAVNKMAAYLKSHPNCSVIIEGYCDERGPEAYNMALGSKRANYIRSILVKQGVHPDQLHTISFGKEKPFATGHGPDVWAQNRRAHFRVHNR